MTEPVKKKRRSNPFPEETHTLVEIPVSSHDYALEICRYLRTTYPHNYRVLPKQMRKVRRHFQPTLLRFERSIIHIKVQVPKDSVDGLLTYLTIAYPLS